MSHQPERKAKNCLNCGATVIGRYCHVCGQENVETKESFWSLTKHFVFDIFHFDGKFFHTLKYIFARPGWVAREYCLGKRMSFLHPIRMYLFTSAIFFLVFASLNRINFENSNDIKDGKMSVKDRLELAEDYGERLRQRPGDSSLSKIIALLKDTSRVVTNDEIYDSNARQLFTISGNRERNVREYDSIQNSLPSNEKDGWFKHILKKKTLSFKEKYKGRTEEASKILGESFLHRMPYMLFLSLPFFALILNLLYVRRKVFYYSDHAIFTIYHYILSFILLLVMFSILTLEDKTDWDFLSYLVLVIFFAWPVYLLLEMKNFYRQGWVKTIGKFFLLNLLGLMIISILFMVFALLSIFEL